MTREAHTLAAGLFREQAGRLTARLARLLGPGSLAEAEDMVQSALLKALAAWPVQGIPANPAGWLWSAARNEAVDRLRRRRFTAPVTPEDLAEALPGDPTADPTFAEELADERLALVFACCHPLLPRESQVALTLKTVCGLSTAEIARAFLAAEPTVGQRLVRAKARLAEARVPFAIPAPDELPARLVPVLETVYLLFTEGHNASGGDSLVRADLAAEALRLSAALADHPVTGRPEAEALAALIHLQAARLSARTDEAGDPVLLPDQDRSRWDPARLARGFRHLRASLAGPEETRWHLEAAIAAAHAAAPDWAGTDWAGIVALYDRLLALHPSPVVQLNRAVALAERDGPRAGLDALAALDGDPFLARYPLHAAVRAELHRRLGQGAEAAALLRHALSFPLAAPERRLLERRLAGLAAG